MVVAICAFELCLLLTRQKLQPDPTQMCHHTIFGIPIAENEATAMPRETAAAEEIAPAAELCPLRHERNGVAEKLLP